MLERRISIDGLRGGFRFQVFFLRLSFHAKILGSVSIYQFHISDTLTSNCQQESSTSR